MEVLENVLCCIPLHRKGDSLCYFLRAQGTPSDVVKEDIRARVDTIHAMLGLAKDQPEALIRQGRPLLGEYLAPPSGHPLHFFPTEERVYDYCATYAGL